MHAPRADFAQASSYQLWAPAPPLELLLTPPFLLSGLSGLDTEEGAATAGVWGLCLYLSLRSMLLVGTVSELREASVLLMSLIEDILTRSYTASARISRDLTFRRLTLPVNELTDVLVKITHSGIASSRQACTLIARLSLNRLCYNFPHMTAAPLQQELNSLAAACQRIWSLDVNRLQPGQDYDLNPQVGCTSRLA